MSLTKGTFFRCTLLARIVAAKIGKVAFLDPEIQRILDIGNIEVRLNSHIGKDVSAESLEKDYDAVLWAIGCWTGRDLPVPNSDAPNCISAIKYLEASRQKRLQVTAKKVVCIGGGDTSIDVVCSSRRLGTLKEELSDDIKPCLLYTSDAADE